MADYGSNHDYGDSEYKDEGDDYPTPARHEYAMRTMWYEEKLLDEGL